GAAPPAITLYLTPATHRCRWSACRAKPRAMLPAYTQEQLTEELAELEVAAQYIGGDIQLRGGASYQLQEDPEYKAPLSGKELTLRTDNFTLDTEVSKKFLHTGTTVAVGLSGGLRTQSKDGGTASNTATITPKLSLTQDLLKNFFGLLSRLGIADAERRLAIAKQKRSYQERQLQQRYDQLYLDWILLWRTQNVLLAQLRKSTSSLANAQKQRSLNYIDNGSYQHIRNSHYLYRQALLDNQQQLLSMDQNFARFLGEGLYRPDSGVQEPLLEKAMQAFDELHFEDSWTWSISEKSLQRLQILYKYSKLDRLPDLSLSTSLGLETSAAYSGSAEPKYSKLKPRYSLALKLSWPVLMRRANNTRQKSRVQLRQLETTLNSQRQDFEIRVVKQRSAQEFLLEAYAIGQEVAKAKKAIYVSNQVKYAQARASVRDLLDAEIQKLSAELNILKIETRLIRGLLDYHYETRSGDFLKL
ncbi:MAG: TolC family protein, partial [Spirochaetota bacterium]